MKIDLNNIICKNQIQINRTTQACDYFYNDKFLFHERSYFPWNIFNKTSHSQWFVQFVLTKEECDKITSKFGGITVQHFYSEENEYFPAFKDNDKAVKFVMSEDYDKLRFYE